MAKDRLSIEDILEIAKGRLEFDDSLSEAEDEELVFDGPRMPRPLAEALDNTAPRPGPATVLTKATKRGPDPRKPWEGRGVESIEPIQARALPSVRPKSDAYLRAEQEIINGKTLTAMTKRQRQALAQALAIKGMRARS